MLHTDVLAFIKLSIRNDLTGIYNLTSSKNITLKEVAALFKKKVKFGRFLYNVGNIDNKKVALASSYFKKTSEEVIRQFLK